MGTIKMSGIIISENNLGDYDKMLTMKRLACRNTVFMLWRISNV